MNSTITNIEISKIFSQYISFFWRQRGKNIICKRSVYTKTIPKNRLKQKIITNSCLCSNFPFSQLVHLTLKLQNFYPPLQAISLSLKEGTLDASQYKFFLRKRIQVRFTVFIFFIFLICIVYSTVIIKRTCGKQNRRNLQPL